MIGREVRGGPTQVDELLVPLLEETSEAEWQNLLVCLVAEHATPVIKKILRYKLLTGGEFDGYSQQDSEDIHSEIILKLVARLLKIRDNPISSFRDYIAVTTYNACHDYFRRKNPERASLKSRLRYLVSHHPDFYIRERGGGDWLCGLAAWSEPDKTSKVGDDQRFRPRTTSLADTLPRIRQLPLAGLAYTIFSWAGRPMDIDELTNAVGKMVGVTSPSAPARHETASSDILDVLPDTQLDIEAELERRLYVTAVWDEIRSLPHKQRIVLLMTARDSSGTDIVAMLDRLRVASIRQIAGALGLPALEFAEMSNRLPLGDAELADYLSISRVQVASLRQAARRRLARRIKDYGVR